MTAHVQDPSMPVGEAIDTHPGDTRAGRTSTRPRWLVPGIAVGVVVAGLVLAGVVSLSTALYAGLFGGMLVMHLGGHGMHGGHGGGGHGGPPGGGSSSDGRAPSKPQRMSQPDEPGSLGETGNVDPDEGPGIETPQHDQRGSHGCH
jgi:hypothetical protein